MQGPPINPGTVLADLQSHAVVTLIGLHKFDTAVRMSAFVLGRKICKPQEVRDVDTQLLGTPSAVLSDPCAFSHQPTASQKPEARPSLCNDAYHASSGALIVRSGWVGEELSFLAEGGLSLPVWEWLFFSFQRSVV